MGSKKMMLAAVLLVVLLAAVPVCAEGDYTDTAAVMRLGLGARALGMGGAHIAVADDAAVIYYNPAGLGRLEEFSLTSMYSNQYGAGSYFGLGAAGMNLGAAVLRFGSSSIEETDEYGNPIGEFGVSETAAIAGYGRTVFSGLSVGGALKYYNQDLPGNSGSGFTADVGILYELLEGKALVGLVGRNLFGSVSYASGLKDSFERSFGVGVSFTPMENLLVAADAAMEDGLTGRVGLEYVLRGVALRAGGSFGGESYLTMGAGFALENFRIDYAYVHHRHLPDSHKISLSIAF
ncbi:PorV/PorQ family protein [Candidatus Darwinibacter acetoxidans]|jgi:hypothetical protein